MSLFSGKCDFCDSVGMSGVYGMLSQYDVFLYGQIIPLRFESPRDLIPYYPYIVGMSAWSNGRGVIHLSKESYVDTEEREHLQWMQKDCVRYVNRCKRKKTDVQLDYFKTLKYESSADIKTEILRRVTEKNMSLDGIHLPLHEYYRKCLYEEMVNNGWDESEARLWCFGWRKNYEN